MSEAKSVVIDFNQIEGPVYTGRQRGEGLRAKYKLDDLDKEQVFVEVQIPQDTYSISSSFFLGFFGESVVYASSKDSFFGKYRFVTSDMFKTVLEGYVARALQEKQLLSPKK